APFCGTASSFAARSCGMHFAVKSLLGVWRKAHHVPRPSSEHNLTLDVALSDPVTSIPRSPRPRYQRGCEANRRADRLGEYENTAIPRLRLRANDAPAMYEFSQIEVRASVSTTVRLSSAFSSRPYGGRARRPLSRSGP